MPKQYKLDLFNFLNNISQKNQKFYDTLSDEEIKELSPLILMRWLSGTNDPYQIYMLNELLNPFVFSLGKHKELLVDLMTLSTSGRSQRYKFKKVKSNKNTKLPNTVKVIKEYFNYSTLDAIEVMPLIKSEELLSLAEQLGRQKPEIARIKKELKTRQQ